MMKKRNVMLLALLCILGTAFLVAPVAADLTITDGEKITATDGVTSPVITINDTAIEPGGTITIDITELHQYVVDSFTFTTDNVAIDTAATAAGWTVEVVDNTLTLNSTIGAAPYDTITLTFTGAVNPWVDTLGVQRTAELTATRSDELDGVPFKFVIITGTPSTTGLMITDGDPIISPYGATSPLITIAGSKIPAGGTITIDVLPITGLFARWTVTDANIVITSNATAASWTGAIADDYLTLTSTGVNTSVGEAINVTFRGTAGNPWIAYTGGPLPSSLTATRNDGYDPGIITIVVDTVPPPPAGLSIENVAPITTTNGATSPVITITDSPIEPGGNITIFVPFLPGIIASGNLNNATIVINDTAADANWTCAVTGDRLILTSTGGPTAVGETVNVTFTGAANPWIVSLPVGIEYPYIPAVRGDERGTGYFTFAISTQDPTALIIGEGAKINATEGATSPVITITGSYIAPEGTISIDVYNLHTYVASGNFTDANVMISDTAANATWTHAVTGDYVILTSTGGPTAADENVTVTFTGATNPWKANTFGEMTEDLYPIRTDGAGWDQFTGASKFSFVINTTPPPGLMVVANFTASPRSDMAPLTVKFTDTSLGNPTSWSWDINNDGVEDYTTQNPFHTYTDVGTYTVSLIATNEYGSDPKTRWDYIKVLNGTVREVNTTITGLTITNCGGPQTITVDTSVLPAALIPNNSVLEIQPPADRGLKNITIYALDGVGFSQNGTLITGNPTGVHLVTEEITPSTGFSGDIGTNASFNYSIDLSSYPCSAILSTKIWDGIITEYDTKLWQIASGNVPPAFPVGTAYSAKITKTNFPSGTPAKIHMSVNSSWNPSIFGEYVFIWRVADDGNSGQILPTNYLYTDPVNNLDYFEADSPLGFSTFGISSFTGPNNPFQMIAFVATNVISPPSNPGPASGASSGGGSGAGQTTVASGATPPDQSKTVKIYSNDEGTITQATTLQSTDGIAKISLDLGIVARDSNGRPLESLSIRRIPAEELPAAPPLATFSFAGIAYEIGPDGATFSPAIPLSFTIPQELWGQEHVIQAYDHATGTWQALPGSYDAQTGTITVQVSHLCCFALFAKSTGTEQTVTPEPTIIIASKSPISTNIEMYGWLFAMIVQNPVTLVIMLAALAMVAYFGWWKRRL
jgi:PKD repeat protein